MVGGCASIAGLGEDYVLGPGGTGAEAGVGGSGADGAGTTTAAGGTTTGAASGAGGGVSPTGGAGGDAPGGAAAGGGALGGSGGGALDSVAAALDGARIELPCTGAASGAGCPAAATSSTVPIGGTPGQTYRVRLRVRGVVEQNHYVGGTTDGSFVVGGAADNAGWNLYQLDVTALGQHYFFNQGATGILHCFSVDYQADIFVRGGEAVTLVGDALDGQQVRNVDDGGTPVVVPGIPPAPEPFNGQFLQFDVVEVALP